MESFSPALILFLHLFCLFNLQVCGGLEAMERFELVLGLCRKENLPQPVPLPGHLQQLSPAGTCDRWAMPEQQLCVN